MRCNYNATDMFTLVACCLYIWSSVLYIDAIIFLHGYTYFLQPYKNLYGCYALLRRVILSGGTLNGKKQQQREKSQHTKLKLCWKQKHETTKKQKSTHKREEKNN